MAVQNDHILYDYLFLQIVMSDVSDKHIGVLPLKDTYVLNEWSEDKIVSFMKEFKVSYEVVMKAIETKNGEYLEVIKYLYLMGFYSEDDIKLIMSQTASSYEDAKYALKKSGGDLITAILWVLDENRYSGLCTKGARR